MGYDTPTAEEIADEFNIEAENLRQHIRDHHSDRPSCRAVMEYVYENGEHELNLAAYDHWFQSWLQSDDAPTAF